MVGLCGAKRRDVAAKDRAPRPPPRSRPPASTQAAALRRGRSSERPAVVTTAPAKATPPPEGTSSPPVSKPSLSLGPSHWSTTASALGQSSTSYSSLRQTAGRTSQGAVEHAAVVVVLAATDSAPVQTPQTPPAHPPPTRARASAGVSRPPSLCALPAATSPSGGGATLAGAPASPLAAASQRRASPRRTTPSVTESAPLLPRQGSGRASLGLAAATSPTSRTVSSATRPFPPAAPAAATPSHPRRSSHTVSTLTPLSVEGGRSPGLAERVGPSTDAPATPHGAHGKEGRRESAAVAASGEGAPFQVSPATPLALRSTLALSPPQERGQDPLPVVESGPGTVPAAAKCKAPPPSVPMVMDTGTALALARKGAVVSTTFTPRAPLSPSAMQPPEHSLELDRPPSTTAAGGRVVGSPTRSRSPSFLGACSTPRHTVTFSPVNLPVGLEPEAAPAAESPGAPPTLPIAVSPKPSILQHSTCPRGPSVSVAGSGYRLSAAGYRKSEHAEEERELGFRRVSALVARMNGLRLSRDSSGHSCMQPLPPLPGEQVSSSVGAPFLRTPDSDSLSTSDEVMRAESPLKSLPPRSQPAADPDLSWPGSDTQGSLTAGSGRPTLPHAFGPPLAALTGLPLPRGSLMMGGSAAGSEAGGPAEELAAVMAGPSRRVSVLGPGNASLVGRRRSRGDVSFIEY